MNNVLIMSESLNINNQAKMYLQERKAISQIKRARVQTFFFNVTDLF